MLQCLLDSFGGVCGRVVRVVDLESLAPVGSNPARDVWILSCEEAIQLAYGTSVVLLRFPLVIPHTVCVNVITVTLYIF